MENIEEYASMNEQTRERASLLFGALANPSRLRITELLCHNALSVSDICSALSLGQSATSQNLAALTRAGILTVEQKGACRIYRARGPRIAKILALIEAFCEIHELYGTPQGDGAKIKESEAKECEPND